MLISLAAVAASGITWLLAASFLFLAFTHLTGQVESPWEAWWTYYQFNYDNIWMKLYLWLAAILPAIFLLCIIAVVVRFWTGKKAQRTLYGDSTWAERHEMRKGGIKQTKTLF